MKHDGVKLAIPLNDGRRNRGFHLRPTCPHSLPITLGTVFSLLLGSPAFAQQDMHCYKFNPTTACFADGNKTCHITLREIAGISRVMGKINVKGYLMIQASEEPQMGDDAYRHFDRRPLEECQKNR